jgi:hypothetical protein
MSPSEAGGKLVVELSLGMERAGPVDQYFLDLWNFRVGNAAVDGTYGRTFFVIDKAHAFGAFLGNDVIDIFGERRMALAVEFPRRFAFVDSIIGTTR